MMVNRTQKISTFIGHWWFTFILIVPAWLLAEQFWMALARNILLSVRYPYPVFVTPFFFVLDNLTLIIHESGHTIFGLFQWQFLTILGGTLMELLIPLLIFISAWWKHQKVLAQVSLFWLAYALFDSAAYCADAKFQDLPLIGNLPKSAHDFTNMLTSMGLLDHHRTIAWIMYVIGFIILVFSLIWPFIYQQKKVAENDFIDLRSQIEKTGMV